MSPETAEKTPSIVTVARKEFYDSVRARSLWVLTAVFALVMLVAVYAFSVVSSTTPEIETTGEALVSLLTGQGSGFLTAFVSILGLLVGYASVVDERSTGTAKFLLGLPHSRRDFILGKALGRSAILAAAFGVGFVISAVLLLTYESADILTFVGFILLTTTLGVVFVCIGIAVSSSIKTRRRVTATTMAVFFFFAFLWDSSALPRLIARLATGSFDTPEWFGFFMALSPNVAYGNAGSFLTEAEVGGVELFSVGVLTVWLVVPLALGYLRFRKSDI